MAFREPTPAWLDQSLLSCRQNIRVSDSRADSTSHRLRFTAGCRALRVEAATVSVSSCIQQGLHDEMRTFVEAGQRDGSLQDGPREVALEEVCQNALRTNALSCCCL
jgi:hypothetical protein